MLLSHNKLRITWISLLLALGTSGFSGELSENLTELDRIKQQGVIKVITRNAPTTYYIDRNGPTGLEYSLAKRFADFLGVRLQMQAQESVGDLYHSINRMNQYQQHAIDLIAANIAITPKRTHLVQFGPVYGSNSIQLIYNRKTREKPVDWDHLQGSITVAHNSSYEEQLGKLQKTHDIHVSALEDVEMTDLLKMVNDGDIPYTLTSSSEFAMNHSYFSNLSIAFNAGSQKIAWAFPLHSDGSVKKATIQFFKHLRKHHELTQLYDRYYGVLNHLDYVGTKTYMRQVDQRLPKYVHLFKKIGKQESIDWRLLAAVSYQESHWNPHSVSPTGVKGLMMLTQDTAKELNVQNRLDPEQSIRGGAQYILALKERLADRIRDPDRTWFALAAYNAGLGHLEDARTLTEKLGHDPDKWMNVKKTLPLLSIKKWYKNTRYGYFHSTVAVKYVQNIRRYYGILRWITHPPSEALVVNNRLTEMMPP